VNANDIAKKFNLSPGKLGVIKTPTKSEIIEANNYITYFLLNIFSGRKQMKFKPDTSEQKYFEFITAVKDKKWSDVLDSCQNSWLRKSYKSDREGTVIDSLIDLFGEWNIIDIEFVKRAYGEKKKKLNADVVQDIISLIVLETNGKKSRRRLKTRLIKENDSGSPDINGTWGVNPISALKTIGWR